MLIALLWILIVATLCCCIPTLFLPRPVLRTLRIPITEPVLFVRLLGTASLALCLLYFFGILRLHQGRDASDVVMIGLVHCGMSAAIIWRYALHGHFRSWSGASRACVHSAGGILTALAVGLLVAGLWYA